MLTIVATLVISSCAVQKTAENLGPPDPVYLEDVADSNNRLVRDTTVVAPPVSYNYYYRSYFWDDMYRIFFPARYYSVINQPDYRPRHLRTHHGLVVYGGKHGPHSGRRNGFGHSGSAQPVHS
jgi:hypothetical protein